MSEKYNKEITIYEFSRDISCYGCKRYKNKTNRQKSVYG